MAKEETPVQEKPREFSGEERVKVEKTRGADLFDEILSGEAGEEEGLYSDEEELVAEGKLNGEQAVLDAEAKKSGKEKDADPENEGEPEAREETGTEGDSGEEEGEGAGAGAEKEDEETDAAEEEIEEDTGSEEEEAETENEGSEEEADSGGEEPGEDGEEEEENVEDTPEDNNETGGKSSPENEEGEDEDEDGEGVQEEDIDAEENDDEPARLDPEAQKAEEVWNDIEGAIEAELAAGVAVSKEKIKNVVVQKALKAGKDDPSANEISMPLSFLEDAENKNAFIGRKKQIFKKYGYDAALHLGRVRENDHKDWDIHLDSMHPHVVFVCGSRGSGKSYVMGVIAEELARNNHNVGTIVIDPVGVFWSMRFPNRDEKEVAALEKWGLTPEGLDNLKVFIPEGMKKDAPKSTYDATFSIMPSLLGTEDWALTFGMDRFSPTGLLLDQALKKVSKGYKDTEGKYVKAKGDAYSLTDIIDCLENDHDLNSREKGFKPDSIRAIVSRFEAAKSWGIFSSKGTPLGELSRENQLTIIDTSFLEDNVTALVIGVLARRVLAARKLTTRREAATKFKEQGVEELLELDIPPTWMFIDEAHTLIPSGNTKTPATNALVEYVKQGRRPGCSLVFATQQPSAIDTKVLSQLDIMISHKLVFDDDIKAIHRRAPTIVPRQYKSPGFIKTLPIGVALAADRSEETSRAFVMRIRPRRSQHEGRDAETAERVKSLSQEDVEKLIAAMLESKLKKEGMVDIKTIGKVVEMVNAKYSSKAQLSDILDKLEEKGFTVEAERVLKAGYEPPEEEEEEIGEEEGVEGEEEEENEAEEEDDSDEDETPKVDLVSFSLKTDEHTARTMVEKARKKKFLWLFGSEEQLKDFRLVYNTIWVVKYDVVGKGDFVPKKCYIDAMTGEFLHYSKGKFVTSTGARELYDLDDASLAIVRAIGKKELAKEEIEKLTEFSEGKVLRVIAKLSQEGIIGKKKNEKRTLYWVKAKLDLPPSESHNMLGSVSEVPLMKIEAAEKEPENYPKDVVSGLVKRIWPNIVVRKVVQINRPVYKATYAKPNGRERIMRVDGLTGKAI